jgi:hypothetical protein
MPAPQTVPGNRLAGDVPGSRVRQPPPPMLAGDIPESLGVMSALDTLAEIAMDGVGNGVPDAGSAFQYREVGDFERNTPPPRDGYHQKWVRVETVDMQPDAVNYRKHLSMGYQPRDADTAPGQYATQKFGAKRVFAISGSLLMEIPDVAYTRLQDQKRRRNEHQNGAVPFDQTSGGITERDERYAKLTGRDRSIVKTGRDAATLVDD